MSTEWIENDLTKKVEEELAEVLEKHFPGCDMYLRIETQTDTEMSLSGYFYPKTPTSAKGG